MLVNSKDIQISLIAELKDLAAQGEKKRVAFVQFGHDAASVAFVNMKMKLAGDIGIAATHLQKDAATTAEALAVIAEVIEQHYDGIVIQLPLPTGIDTDIVIDSLPTETDIDLLSEDAKNQYRQGVTERTAPVGAAVQEMLWHYKIMLPGKKIVVLGKGRLVGEPVAMLLDRQELPYQWIDIETPDAVRRRAIKEADIVISGIGVSHGITPDMITEGVVLIDAGTSEHGGKLAGDIDPACADKASFCTAVPGGVGPVTVLCLFRNLFL